MLDSMRTIERPSAGVAHPRYLCQYLFGAGFALQSMRPSILVFWSGGEFMIDGSDVVVRCGGVLEGALLVGFLTAACNNSQYFNI